jgi:hypothetical protein
MKKITKHLVTLANGIENLVLVNADEIKTGGAWYSQWSKEYISNEDEYERNDLSSSFYRDGDVTFEEDVPKGEFHYYDENSDGKELIEADDLYFDDEFFCYYDGSNHRAIGIEDNEEFVLEIVSEVKKSKSMQVLYQDQNDRYLLDSWSFYAGDQGSVEILDDDEVVEFLENNNGE